MAGVGIGEISETFALFCCKPKTALKNKINLKKIPVKHYLNVICRTVLWFHLNSGLEDKVWLVMSLLHLLSVRRGTRLPPL